MKIKQWFGVATAVAIPFLAGPYIALADTTTQASTNQLWVTGDVVSSEGGCVTENGYLRGTTLVFRAEVENPDGTFDKNAVVTAVLSNGDTVTLTYGMHPPTAPASAQIGYYTGTYSIPKNASLGVLDYTIKATDPATGATGQYTPIQIPPSLPQIVPGTYNVTVKLTVGGKTFRAVHAGQTINVSATVTSSVEVNHVLTKVPLTSGKVTAELGIAGDVDGKGNQVVKERVTLTYNSKTKTWNGNIRLPKDATNAAWTILVNAADNVSPVPNTGSTSAVFSVTK